MDSPARHRYRHVVCPIDFSDASRKALRYAAAFAARAESTLTVLFVNDPLLSTAAAAAGYNPRRLASQTDVELRRFARNAVANLATRVRVEFATALGDPAREIRRFARVRRADLVVMGTHGLRGGKKLLLGSTTERTLQTSRVPVLAVPHGAPRRPPSGWPSAPLVAAIDLGASARADVRAAANIARFLSAELLIVHVIGKSSVPAWFKRAHRRDDDQRLEEARAKLARVAAAVDSDVAVSFRVVRGDPAATLAKVARAVKAAMLLLVLRDGAGPFGRARGAMTYDVLTSAVTPVLALPGKVSDAPRLRVWK